MLLWHRSHLTGELPSIQVCCITCERRGGGCCSHKPSSLLSGSVAASWIWDLGGAVSQGCMLALPCPKHPLAQPRQVSAALCSTWWPPAPSKHPLPCRTKPGMGLPRLGTCKSCNPQGVKKKITHNKTGRTPWGRRWKGQRGAVCWPPTHIGVSLGLGVGADAGGDLFGHAPLVDGVFADWQEGRRR